MSIPTNHNTPSVFVRRSDPPQGLPRFSNLASALLLCGLTFVVYLPSLRGPFLIDDDRYVTSEPLVASSDGLSRMWSTSQLLDFWPMTYTTFWFEWRLWGTNPAGYHFTNLILHVATALLLWRILQKLSIPSGFLAALVFAVHPVNVQAVAWIAQRKEALAAFFFGLSILWYLCDQQRRDAKCAPEASAGIRPWYWLSLIAFALAMLSKTSAAMLPAVLLLIVWWVRGRITAGNFLRSLPFFLVAAGLTCVEIWFQGHGDPHPHSPFPVRLAGSGAVVWFYLAKALLPIDLSFVYPRWSIQPNEFCWWLPLLAAITVTILLGRRRNGGWAHALFFAWAYVCIALLPVMGFVETGSMMYSPVADHYSHLALIGVLVLLAAAWSYWRQRVIGACRWITIASAVILVGIFGLLTWRQNQLFGNPVELYQIALASNPDSGNFLHGALAAELLAVGRKQEQIEQYKRLVRLSPNLLPMVHYNLGNMLIAAGKYDEGVEHYRQALRLQPEFADAHYNLGVALANAGKSQEAVSHFEKTLQLKPGFAEAHNNLANVLRSTGHIAEAIDHYREALRLNPDLAVVHRNLGDLLRDTGETEEAVKQYQQVLRLQPDDAATLAKLTKAFAALGRSEEAISTAQHTLNSARSQGNATLAQQIEDWLTQYRAQQANSTSRSGADHAAP